METKLKGIHGCVNKNYTTCGVKNDWESKAFIDKFQIGMDKESLSKTNVLSKMSMFLTV